MLLAKDRLLDIGDEIVEYSAFVAIKKLEETVWSEDMCKAMFVEKKLLEEKKATEDAHSILSTAELTKFPEYEKCTKDLSRVRDILDNIKKIDLAIAIDATAKNHPSEREAFVGLRKSVENDKPLPKTLRGTLPSVMADHDRTEVLLQRIDNIKDVGTNLRRLSTSMAEDNYELVRKLLQNSQHGEKLVATFAMLAEEAKAVDPNYLEVERKRSNNTVDGTRVIEHVEKAITVASKNLYLVQDEDNTEINKITSAMMKGLEINDDDDGDEVDEEAIVDMARKLGSKLANN